MAPGPDRFRHFVAIDWSGARSVTKGSIALAECRSGTGAPQLIEPNRYWTREAVHSWLMGRANEDMLAGIDLSFSGPFVDSGSYLPGGPTLSGPAALWAEVEKQSGDGDLGAHGFLEAHSRHFYTGSGSGSKARFQRWRVCEERFNAAGGGKASSIFDCVGPSQVAKASFSGMRMLHRLSGHIAIWPFDPLPARGSVLVEIYTRAMIRLAGLPGHKLRTGAAIDAALVAIGSEPTGHDGALSDHESDALIAAAGLRRLAAQPESWHPSGVNPDAFRLEGWTFGVA